MNDDLSDIRTWVHAPEGLLIIGLTTFFVSITLFESAILPRILPVDRLERQIFSDQGGTQLLLDGAKYFCDVNGLHLVGFKFLFNESSQSAARPLSHLDARALYRGVACWNFHKGDWDQTFATAPLNVGYSIGRSRRASTSRPRDVVPFV